MDLRKNRASLTLDFMRAVAAQAVCVGHAIGLFGVVAWAQPPYAPYMQNVAVLVFFMLSGFLIAYTLDSRSRSAGYGFDDYLVDRFARIYSALVPCLAAIAVIDLTVIMVTGTPSRTLTVRAFFGNLLMVQDAPLGPLRWFHVPSFGTAGQLWTLAVEWHLYVLAGAIYFFRRSPALIVLALFAHSLPWAYFGRVTGQDFGHGVAALWAAGFAGYYALPRMVSLPMWFKVGVTAFSVAAYFFLVPPGAEYTRVLYILLFAGFLGAVSVAASFQAAAAEGEFAKVIRFLAAYSFTLYLVHNSIVKAFAKLWNGDPYVAAGFSIVVANAVSIAIAVPTEMRHRQLANRLHRLLRTRGTHGAIATNTDSPVGRAQTL